MGVKIENGEAVWDGDGIAMIEMPVVIDVDEKGGYKVEQINGQSPVEELYVGKDECLPVEFINANMLFHSLDWLEIKATGRMIIKVIAYFVGNPSPFPEAWKQ